MKRESTITVPCYHVIIWPVNGHCPLNSATWEQPVESVRSFVKKIPVKYHKLPWAGRALIDKIREFTVTGGSVLSRGLCASSMPGACELSPYPGSQRTPVNLLFSRVTSPYTGKSAPLLIPLKHNRNPRHVGQRGHNGDTHITHIKAQWLGLENR